ncbi:hypothetical protein RM697_08425 [Ichthyenterobacterium sp. W332]|uniref:Uncharacterized protein n=1 Tax=Microcosmobacter mediterraneus TaxID=3075607 RepID=A0ABU2YKH6_9FLAO|nr:hypothetical protein [Ichthyenterobacterium sp. W332]MDT0558669.1 hypothetical protein [Ichthyenterobacterium sp. W332]
MDNQQQNLKRRKDQSLVTDKPTGKSLIIGSIIATFIAITPYLFYLYESIPETQVWENWLFTYDSKSWADANFAMWVFTNKVIPFCFILIWFFTCRHWWYHVLLVPIAMYIYQIVGIFNDNIEHIDKFELLHLIPVMAIVIPSIYLLRARMFNKLNTADKTMQELEEEFMIKPKGLVGKLKQYF